MRRAAKVDANQSEIVKSLRAAGATVQSLSNIGQGCPDILVGFGKRTFVFEIKDPCQVPSKRMLTYDERCWHSAWNGQVDIVETAEEALSIIAKGNL